MPKVAERIVSLLPSATEWVCALGLGDRLVGVSHECDYPDHVDHLPRLTRSRIDIKLSSQQIDELVRTHSESRTSLYDLDHEPVAELNPDLIVTQTLCDVCAVSPQDLRRSLSSIRDPCQVLDLQAATFDAVIDDARAIAAATGSHHVSLSAIRSLEARIRLVRNRMTSAGSPRPRVTLLEWTDPLFCAGHWTPQLIEWAGGDDPIGRSGQPSRVIEMSQLHDCDPDILLVACCGLSADRTASELSSLQQQPGWSDLNCVAAGNVHSFDGSAWFNRPGPRLVDALEAVADLVAAWKAAAGAPDR